MTVFTQEQLDDMVRSPAERIDRVFSENDPDLIAALFDDLTYRYREAIELYGRWAAAMIAHLALEYGIEAAERACRIENLLIGASNSGVEAQQLVLGASSASRSGADADSIRDEVLGLTSAQALEEARNRWNQLIESYREVHDLRRDWVTEILSEIYRSFGSAGLEKALRYAHESAWISRPSTEPTPPLEELLPIWAAKMAIGHYGTVSIREHDTGWTLTLDPCGSCGRQVRDGRYSTFSDFEVVRERCPITFSRDGMSVYQTHLAVVHGLVGIERNGVPSPAILCSGTSGNACELTIYKDRTMVPPEHYHALGYVPPPTESESDTP